MDREPQHLKIPRGADNDNTEHAETESGLEDSRLPSELLDSLERQETTRSPGVSAEKRGGAYQVEEIERNAAADVPEGTGARTNVLDCQGTGLMGTTGAAHTDSSRSEDGRESASKVERERKQQEGSTPEGNASMAACTKRTEADKCTTISTDRDLSRHVLDGEPVADKTTARCENDLAQTAQSASCSELCTTGRRTNDDKKSKCTVGNAQVVDASAGDAANAEAGSLESKASEKQSSMQGRWSAWNQYISHELSMPVRRRPPQEAAGPPLSLTAVGQRLLQVFRERQETAQSIARERNEENYNVMQEMLPELRVPGHKTLQECQEELARATAMTPQESEDGQPQAAATVPHECQDKPPRLSTMIPEGFMEIPPGPAPTTPVGCQDMPSRPHPRVPEDCQNTLSHPASLITAGLRESSNTSAAMPKNHEDETPWPSATIPEDRQDEPPRPTEAPLAGFRALPSRTTATIPDYRHGKRSRHSPPPSPQVREEQLVSTFSEQASASNLIRQSRASAFSVFRKLDFEKKPSPLAVASASTVEPPSENPTSAKKSGHPAVKRIDFSLKISPKKETASHERAAAKRSLSSDSDTTDDTSSVGPPESKRRAEEAVRVGEQQDTSDDSIPSPQAVSHQSAFRAIETAPVAGTSGMQGLISRPVPMRAQQAAKEPSTGPSEDIAVGKQPQSIVHSSTSTSSSSDSGVTASSDSSSTDMDASSAPSTSSSATTGDSEHQPKEVDTSSRSDSDGSKTAAGCFRGTKAQRSVKDGSEPSGRTSVVEKSSAVTESGDTEIDSTSHAGVKRGPDRPDALFAPINLLKTPDFKADRFGASLTCSDSSSEDDELSPKCCSSEKKGKNKAAARSVATRSGGESPTESAGDGKTAALSSTEVARNLQAALEDGRASCSGFGAEASSALASSSADRSRKMSGTESNISTSSRYGGASSSSGDELSLFHFSSDDEPAAEDVESSTEGSDDAITF
ncbi:pneumococcal serine-rich repeat protein-like [Dermacentor albipictus]|uniref:pneumococcal serine-rich repeat protein-like n=1 Tax=Dermacentor albipictus TaxID=60249 RepID=UPI0031FD6F6D